MSTSLASALASRVRQERLRLGWTQAEVVARSGIPSRSYQRFEATGVITLHALERVLAALGLSFGLTSSDASAAPAPDPRLARARQRGLRRAQPAPAPSPTPTPSTGTASPAPRAPRPLPASRPSPAQVAAMAEQHRQRIMLLVRAIVFNRLNNYTAHQVVVNTMNSAHLAEAERPAFIGAVTAQLNGLNAQTIQAFSISPADFERWARDWDPTLGIVDAYADAARSG
ncbi:helix-turn-helix transcriptional regulator [Opitutus sp. ER46]|uniref:helix-turn-helix domain-containing protein n=1 Tax=Opitutus sp. ER46 TaxID=2161864 RepID=UPI000D3121F8|nr:helix-turn-helix transcriptional regulator [Opitutus sp. ER46]PTX90633.1 hypothetical protein DB354_18345 [Opitutus sp. ER46]